VERPKTGHRHPRTGSAITVVDLTRGPRGPVRIPSADEVDTETFVGDLLGPPVGDQRPRGWVARAAKLIGLATGSLVLCASVVAASTLAHDRRPTPVTVVSTTPGEVTGAGVLRPDTIARQLSAGHHPGASTGAPAGGPTSTALPAASTTVVVPPPAGPSAGPAPAAVAKLPPPGTLSAAAADNLVREFYLLAGSQPDAAADLVAPSLLAADPLGFTASWSSVRQVRVDSVQADPTGAVRAVVDLLQPDGSWLRLVELLRVTMGDPPMISGAQLLSAQHG
jgi:hypothetical protein